MIGGIRADKIDVILSPPKAVTDDDKWFEKQWIIFFIIFGGFTLAAIGLLVYRLMFSTKSPAMSVFLVLMALVMDAYVVFKYVRAKVIIPKRYKAAIAKYGMEELKSQLADSAAFGFFVDEDEYENLAILTMDYFMGASEFIYALKDIKSITVSKRDINEEGIRKLKSEHTKNVLRCVYSAEFTLTDGSKKKQLFAMTTPDLNAFFGYVQQRAPHLNITYR